jgi:hypothetical protein
MQGKAQAPFYFLLQYDGVRANFIPGRMKYFFGVPVGARYLGNLYHSRESRRMGWAFMDGDKVILWVKAEGLSAQGRGQ